jgi:hypothetical protein
METCVLIPQEFSLVLTAGPAPTVPAAPPAVDRNANKLPEMRVNVWTNARIPQGTLIYPFQGTIRLDKLEVYSYLDDNDVSSRMFVSVLIIVAFSYPLTGGCSAPHRLPSCKRQTYVFKQPNVTVNIHFVSINLSHMRLNI